VIADRQRVSDDALIISDVSARRGHRREAAGRQTHEATLEGEELGEDVDDRSGEGSEIDPG
jgi:hypothetical protein